MTERARLVKRPHDWWNDRFRATSLPVTSAVPLWRSRRGFLIHRPRHGTVYLHDRSRMSLSWYCGNQTNEPIPVKPECMDGLRVCGVCEAKYQAAVGEQQ